MTRDGVPSDIGGVRGKAGLGGVADVVGFEASRLWISSANFTSASRTHLEFGYWTEEPALVQGAERFLVKLMRSCEGLDPDANSFDPDLAPVDYDDVAMAEAWAEEQADAVARAGDRSDDEDGS